jgi:ribosomal protein S13
MLTVRQTCTKVFVLAFALLLIGCSALRLGYSNGESVVYWWLDGYVDLEPDQKPWVRDRIKNLFAWHRKTQLQDYAQLFAQTQQRLQKNTPVTAAEIMDRYGIIRQRSVAVIDKALPDLTDLAMELEPEQLVRLEKKFASNNDSYRKDYLQGDIERRQEARFKKVMKQAEYWFGNFSPEQEKQIRALSDARPLNNELWMAERMERQKQLLATLKKIQTENVAKDAAMGMLREHSKSMFEFVTYKEHKDFFDASREGMAKMVAEMINLATPAQRQHAIGRFQKLIEDCNALSAQQGG